MIKRIWAFVAIIIVGCVLVFSYQNFVGKDKNGKGEHKPASVNDFNSVIEESLSSQDQLAKELEKAHPPARIGKEGLIKRESSMKREVIEGTGEAVVARGSKPFFKNSPTPQVDQSKEDTKRLSQEFEGD